MTKLDIVQKLKIELLNKKIDFVNKEQQLFKDENEVLNNQLKLKKNWIWITLGNNCQISLKDGYNLILVLIIVQISYRDFFFVLKRQK